MAQLESVPQGKAVSGWAVGVTTFAGVMMIIMGIFHFFQGFLALADESFYTVGNGYVFDLDVTAWGWIHLAGGIVIAMAGFWLLLGDRYARMLAVVLAVLSGIGNFLSIPYYPLWSIVLIALDVLVIWGVTTYGKFLDTPAKPQGT
jgi:hypothetical protein